MAGYQVKAVPNKYRIDRNNQTLFQAQPYHGVLNPAPCLKKTTDGGTSNGAI